MAMVTTYICDLTGYSSTDAQEFCYITIDCKPQYGAPIIGQTFVKYVHNEVAHKLGLCYGRKETPLAPLETVPSFEDQLKALLTDYIQTVVADTMTYRGL